MPGLREEILGRNLEELVCELLFERVPFLFGDSWEAYRRWKLEVAAAINVDPSEVVLIGSAAVGFSLDPFKNLPAMHAGSDVDVAVISDKHFSEAWHYLRTVDLTLGTLTARQKYAVLEHQQKYVYWGCIATDRLLAVLPFAKEWLAARSTLSARQPISDRTLNFRIYKDFRALRSYQLRGLNKLRTALATS